MRIAVFTSLLLFAHLSLADTRHLIVDHDGGVDDLAALAMVVLSPGIDVQAVTICPADSFKNSAVNSTRGLLKFLDKKSIDISASDDAGVNPFPDKWRKDSDRLEKLPQLAVTDKTPVRPASKRLIEILSGKTKYDILATGPLTNIADALGSNPEIAANIGRLYIMGGAVGVPGNVVQPGRNKTAEWNIYNNPGAAKKVFESGIAITLVGLDATNKTPVTKKFMHRLKSQSSKRISALFYDVWKIIAQQIEHKEYVHTYYFWDTLAAAAVIDGKIIQTVPKKLVVVTSGPNEGQTMESSLGNSIDVAVDADPVALEKLILNIFNK